LGRISEFEPRQRDERRSARRSWPVSARFTVGALVVLNLILIAFSVKNELKWSLPTHAPASVKADLPKTEPQPIGNLAPVQESKRDSDESDAAPAGDSNQKVQDIHPQPAKTPAWPSGKSKVENARQAAVSATRRWEATSRYTPTPAPQARFTPPQIQPSRAPASIPAALAAPVPAPSSGTSTPPAMIASVRTPMVGAPTMVGAPKSVGVQNSADTHPKVTPPTSSTSNKAQPTLLPNADSNQKPPTRVASVSLPAMVKGWVAPKMAADSSSPKIQIVHRPPESKADVPNCGGEVVIPCPTLKKRPAGGTPEGDRW
jgi:hypothetical protein